jgi:peptidoglycan-associated lipoprotein
MFKMKKAYRWMALIAASVLLFAGCQQKSSDVWNEQATNSKAKVNSLWGSNEAVVANDPLKGPSGEDFIPLREDDLKIAFSEGAIPQPRETPGEPGSALPGISHFSEPKGILSSVFRTLYFDTDDHVIRKKELLAVLERIAVHLKENPKLYVFVEGHCDERGPEAYNLSLGTRRANHVRAFLVQKGVNSERIHTVSYGKEKPAISGHNAEAWAKNRRAEFKIYNKS